MDVAEVLETALGMERRGRTYYIEAAGRVNDPVMKSVCLSLAADEEEHERMIKQFYEALSKTEGWPQPPDDRIPPQSARARLDEIIGSTAGTIRADEEFLGVYEHALELEKKAFAYYKEGEESTDDPTLIKFFRFLWHVEQTHVQMLGVLVDATRQAAES